MSQFNIIWRAFGPRVLSTSWRSTPLFTVQSQTALPERVVTWRLSYYTLIIPADKTWHTGDMPCSMTCHKGDMPRRQVTCHRGDTPRDTRHKPRHRWRDTHCRWVSTRQCVPNLPLVIRKDPVKSHLVPCCVWVKSSGRGLLCSCCQLETDQLATNLSKLGRDKGGRHINRLHVMTKH